MAISDRIAVMNKGEIQHIGTPKSIYQCPANTFVATFIGRSNILGGRVGDEGDVLSSGMRTTKLQCPMCAKSTKKGQKGSSGGPKSCHQQRVNGGFQGHYPKQRILGPNTHYFMRSPNGLQMESVHESTLDSIIEREQKSSSRSTRRRSTCLLPMALPTSWRAWRMTHWLQ